MLETNRHDIAGKLSRCDPAECWRIEKLEEIINALREEVQILKEQVEEYESISVEQ